MKIEEYPVGSILGDEELYAIKEVFDQGGTLTRGKDVELFEEEFANYCGASYAVSTNSCGSALHIAFKILNLRENDEIICQANSFWATFVQLLKRKVKIIVADIERDTLNIDPESVKWLITEKTKAILLVHHGGNPAKLDDLREIIANREIIIIEDAAHAVGAKYKDNKIGFNSDIACFSFSSLKNMTTLGEGGMLVTNNKLFYEQANGLRTNYPFGKKIKRKINDKFGNYNKPKSVAFMHSGDAWDYDWVSISEIGNTYRMGSVQAAVGRVQLKKLDYHNKLRKKIATKYNSFLKNIPEIKLLKVREEDDSAWHLYNFFLVDDDLNRDKIVQYLEEEFNIEIINRFWPIHLGGIMRMRGHNIGECPVCEDVWFNKQLSFPISPQMTNKEIDYILSSFFKTIKYFRGEKNEKI